jgi:hypothetical protein
MRNDGTPLLKSLIGTVSEEYDVISGQEDKTMDTLHKNNHSGRLFAFSRVSTPRLYLLSSSSILEEPVHH